MHHLVTNDRGSIPGLQLPLSLPIHPIYPSLGRSCRSIPRAYEDFHTGAWRTCRCDKNIQQVTRNLPSQIRVCKWRNNPTLCNYQASFVFIRIIICSPHQLRIEAVDLYTDVSPTLSAGHVSLYLVDCPLMQPHCSARACIALVAAVVPA